MSLMTFPLPLRCIDKAYLSYPFTMPSLSYPEFPCIAKSTLSSLIHYAELYHTKFLKYCKYIIYFHDTKKMLLSLLISKIFLDILICTCIHSTNEFNVPKSFNIHNVIHM